MKSPRLFETMAVFAVAALSLLATQVATAQTVISNETLVSTTFVVNKTPATVKCTKAGCSATKTMLAPVTVACPAATGQTCTFHISLDAKASMGGTCKTCPSAGADSFQFLVDNAAPTIGPTDANGLYLFAKNVGAIAFLDLRQSFPASVLTTVTNSGSSDHTVALNLVCSDTIGVGCEVTSRWSTMRVDVFEP
jgi:hypothetical protein